MTVQAQLANKQLVPTALDDAFAGERRGPRSPPAKGGAWMLGNRVESPEDIDSIVLGILDKVPKTASFGRVQQQGLKIQLQFGLFQTGWNRGFGLERTTLERIALVGASLVFDIYCECEGSGVELSD